MARRIESCLRVTGALLTMGPLHVGGIGGDADVDLLLATDGQGRLYVPGTSLAGALRDFMLRSSTEQDVNDLWGYQEQDRGHASFLLVEDGLIQTAAAAEIREGVGIDRCTGAAAEHIKYNRQVLPRGSRIALCLTMEVESAAKQSRQIGLLTGLLRALERGAIRLGAARTRGLGGVKLVDLSIREDRLGDKAGMLAALRALGARPAPGVTLAALESRRGPMEALPLLRSIELEIRWRPVGPLMVKAERDGMAVDMLPLVSAVDRQVALVLPGSSIKGALRSHAERIVRTVRRTPAQQSMEPRRSFLQSMELPLIRHLFGCPGRQRDAALDDAGAPVAGLGALGVDDCYATSRCSPQQWSAVELAANEGELRAALNGAGLSRTQQAFHVAVDRWTGGAADSFLYSTLEPHGSVWEPLILRFDPARLPELEGQAGLALLLLTLQDMARGRVPLGFGTNRGMGAVAIDAIHVRSEGEALVPDWPEAVTLPGGLLSALPLALRESLAQGWRRWIDANQEETR